MVRRLLCALLFLQALAHSCGAQDNPTALYNQVVFGSTGPIQTAATTTYILPTVISQSAGSTNNIGDQMPTITRWRRIRCATTQAITGTITLQTCSSVGVVSCVGVDTTLTCVFSSSTTCDSGTGIVITTQVADRVQGSITPGSFPASTNLSCAFAVAFEAR